MKLANAILTYYFTHTDQLTVQKRFHLASRLLAWNGDERAKDLLANCKSWLVPAEVNNETLALSLAEAAREATQAAPEIVAFTLRRPYFERYPALLNIEAELFRVRHLGTLFGIDAVPALLRRHPDEELRRLTAALLADPEAVRSLSTWAVNFVYLAHLLLWDGTEGINREFFYTLGESYDVDREDQLRLLIYLYTHCVIVDSNFYARPLPPVALPTYTRMLQKLETLLAARLHTTTLDSKLEFLVCCKLAHYTTRLEQPIHDECARSLSPNGTFLVDTHNSFASNPLKKSFQDSEHRNVLFAMSVLPRLGS